MKSIIKTLEDRIGYIILLAGVGLIFLAFLADILDIGGQTGFGAKQTSMVFVGVLLSLVGILLATPAGHAYFLHWIYPTPADRQFDSPKNLKDRINLSITLAVWFGLLTGLSEVSYRLFDYHVFEKVINFTQHFVWLAPLTYLVIFMFIGLFLSLIKPIKSWSINLTILIATLSFMSLMAFYFYSSKIHILAAALLFAGISYQVARFLQNRFNLFYKMVTATVLWLLTFVLASAAFLIAYIN